jgi:hypothetical protein
MSALAWAGLPVLMYWIMGAPGNEDKNEKA